MVSLIFLLFGVQWECSPCNGTLAVVFGIFANALGEVFRQLAVTRWTCGGLGGPRLAHVACACDSRMSNAITTLFVIYLLWGETVQQSGNVVCLSKLPRYVPYLAVGVEKSAGGRIRGRLECRWAESQACQATFSSLSLPSRKNQAIPPTPCAFQPTRGP
jgi:hypothetical protein